MGFNRSFLECLSSAAAGAALFLAGVSEPTVGPLAAFFCPAAFLLTTVRNGVPNGTASVLLASSLVLPFVPSVPAALSLPFGLGLPSLLLGYLLQRRRSIVRASFLAAVLSVCLSFAASAGHYRLAGLNPSTYLRYQTEELLRETRSALEDVGRQTSGLSGEGGRRIMEIVTWTMPSILLCTLVLQFSSNALLSLRLLAKVEASPPPSPDLSAFSLPDYLVWLLIPSFAVALWSPLPPLRHAAVNVTLVLLFFYLVQGLSVTVHLLDRMRVGRPMRMLLIIIALLQPYLLLAPLLAGLLDFRFDFRQPRKPSQGSP